MKNYIISFIIFFTIALSVLIIFSFIFAYTNLDDKYIDLVVYSALISSSFISSFFLGKSQKKRGIINGIGINLMCCLILFIISCILNEQFIVTKTLGLYILTCSLSGVVGGILGVNI